MEAWKVLLFLVLCLWQHNNADAQCTQGAIRLQGGTATQGRVEICNSNVWGTVCDDFWGSIDAVVACRQLGLGGGTALFAGFTNGVGQIWLDNVQCRGTETRLIDCPANTLGSHNCAHFEDAGVRCDTPTPCTQGAIRLQAGTSTQGRVEVCNQNVWGTVCDDLWGTPDAQVVCRQLGLPTTGAVALTSGFTNGAGVIWLDNVQCRGTETRLIDCPANALGSHNCAHFEDAGVRCQGTTTTCTQGAIRLQGGTATQGRVEICNTNIWGTVCDDFWGNVDARVACRQLGFTTTGAVALTTGFTNGAGQIWLDNVQCRGTETRLIDCPANPLGNHNCVHAEDAGVRCQGTTTCTQGAIRLQGGTTTQGRVEICNTNIWGTVCDDAWGTPDAQVACRQLGFPTTGATALTLGAVPDGTGQIWLDNVNCRGTEARLIDCPANALGSHNCVHAEDAGVRCQSTTTCTQGAIRLQGGTATQGRVEICNANVWGTVCDDFWGTPDAQVACRQLGFSTTGATALTTGFTNGAGQIWLDNVQCRGTETRLIDCPANTLGSHNCAHFEDAGVRCSGTTCVQGDVRLQGGGVSITTVMTGRVEICNNNVWGTVCDDFWGTPDAQVVCRQLGLGTTGAAAITTGFTNGAGQIWLDNVQCTGREARLVDCTYPNFGTHNCVHSEDAGVTCPTTTCTTGAIRLRGGTSIRGRVEVCNNNVWGTVCDDFWGNVDAQVACRQLGLSFTGSTALTLGAVPDGTGQIWLDNVQCRGTETRLIDCPRNSLGSHNCVHSEDAGANCQLPSNGCTQGDIRLQGLNAAGNQGRVEICNNNVWGTVCDDLWGTPDAQVACRQLGFSTTGAVALTTGFINGQGQIWLDNVQCRGTETRLIDCPANALGSHNCNHGEDAGVRCQSGTCTQGAIRLQGGTASRGRVEICNNNIWGTVCDDAWGTPDAQVACRQLGFTTTGATALTLGAVPDGAGQIWLDNVNCRGTETRLIDCPANTLGSHNCVHSEDAGVNCPTGTQPAVCTQNSIRLQGGANSRTGRVEVCNNNIWGTVCDDFWDNNDATVACRQLGFSDTGAVALTTGFTNGAGQIWLDNVQCTGRETNLFSCSHLPVGTHNCAHFEDAGVRCQAGCPQNFLRLLGGANAMTGRVEICNNNIWGTVCDDFWGAPDAQVVCRQLGFSPTGAVALTTGFTNGAGQIWLDNVQCVGTETTLASCPHLPFGTHNCGHSEDAGVRCQPLTTTCTQNALRLQGGANNMTGRVEICNNNIWGTVCDDFWGTPDAQVVCRQLGFSATGAVALFTGFTNGAGQIWLDNVNCRGTETTLASCPHLPFGTHNCGHVEDAGVRCQPLQTCTQGAIRLQGGTTTQGRVEICNNNEWGTVCDDLWGTPDAQVACRQLGFAQASATALTLAAVPDGTGRIWLDNVQCRGTESRLIDCPANALGSHNCAHFEDAGVSCSAPCTQGAIRLQGGANNMTGRVEICNANVWGTVCDDFWGTPDAQVACRQLGFSSTGAVALTTGFTNGVGQIWLDNVQCRGTETRLIDCPRNALGSHNCAHFEDAGVRCVAGCTQGAIRLQGSTISMQGRVEICNNNIWGTVCDDAWGTIDANVACRQLGFSDTGAVALTTGFTNGAGQIWLDDVQCRGTETRLIDCPARPLGTHNCGHVEDAGVRCLPLCNQGDIRLQGGANNMTGRVEVCNNQTWGTVCDDAWGAADASVTCRQLGFLATGAVALFTGFTNGAGQIWLDNVNCRGTETRLIDCPANPLGNHNCVHGEDAGVRCSLGCTRGDIRLRGGANSLTGRVEICNNNVWGTVCDDFWGTPDVTVVCRQLGHSTVGAVALFTGFTNGAGQIWLDNVQCRGTESRLIDCPANALGSHNCVHGEDAGVRCQLQIVCNQGDLRLQGGNATFGRVEVCNNNQWGTVCDDLYGVQEAMVICRQLGFAVEGARALTSGFPNGAAGVPIWLDNLQCTGTETSLFSCRKNTVGTHNCVHGEDAGVSCQSGCPTASIRLRDGRNNREGRVEICYNNEWGTICDDGWGNLDARVVCRQLGFSTNNAFALTTIQGIVPGTGRTWLDSVQCRGNETLLYACPSNPIGNENCLHTEDAGVRCQPGCPSNAVRLVGSNANALMGRVEICNNNIWGTVCDDFWGTPDANVVCRQLGYRTTGARAITTGFPNGAGQIWLDNVACVGNETTLASCPHPAFGTHNCNHNEDAGVTCQPAVCTEGDIRLRGSTIPGVGRVEICHENVWGTVCDDFWGTVDAAVACRQLGYIGGGVMARTGGFSNGAGQIWLDNVACNGRENRLIDCAAAPFGVHNCVHSEDAGVRCPAEPCTEGDIRVVGGRTNNTGRLEVCHNNLWGTVCDDAFGTPDATVACRQLGFNSSNARVLPAGQVADAIGRQIWLDNVNCRGTEARLVDCRRNAFGSHNCAHSEDVGVTCQQFVPVCAQGDIRVVDGTSNHTGRLEICNANEWGTVCDDFFFLVDARVACRQLGFSDANATPLLGSQVTSGTGQIWLDNVRCSGNENRLIDCNSNALGVHNCNHNEDAGVACFDSVCVQSSIRIIGGANNMTGRVEICFNNQWGTICDNQWSTPDASVTCRQAGYLQGNAVAITSGFTNAPSSTPIFNSNVRCNGGERRLIDCPKSGNTNPVCDHTRDAGVRCRGGCTQGDLRITGSTSPRFGRLEICNQNVWGQICDTQWDDLDAQVACRQLGYSPSGAAAITTGFQNSVGTIWLDNVRCVGTEMTLLDCPTDALGTFDCTDVENAGIRCELECTTGDVRLIGGTSNLNGRLEICYNGTWGTICDDFFGVADANVVCRQLGFRSTGGRVLTAGFPNGVGQIWLDDLRCSGTENYLDNCTHSAVGVHNCNHGEDVGVVCLMNNPAPVCREGDLRLQGGRNISHGRVEVCNNNVWGTVCDDFWSGADARVACGQLGFSTSGATAITTGFTNGAGQIWLDNVRCTGTESRLIDCPANALGVHNCVHAEDAGVNCQILGTCTNGDLRINGTSTLAGRLEVCFNNTWGTVCDDAFGSQEAVVACRQMGFSDAGAIPLFQRLSTRDPVTPGTGPIWLDNVNCGLVANRLFDCPRGNPIGTHNCNHNEDAGVRCEPVGFRDVCRNGQVRLLGGANPREGRVEVCYYNQWGTVCDDQWGAADARVVCRQLGWTGGTPFSAARFGQGAGTIVLDNVRCVGNETDLMSCPALTNHNCNHAEDAGVRCANVVNSVCDTGAVRLNVGRNARGSQSGRVEVCNNNDWGTVCDDDWGFKDGLVVCRQLGFRGVGGGTRSNAFFGQGAGNIWLDQVRCQGYEDELFDCPSNSLGREDCTHGEDAGVECSLRCAHGDIRLSGTGRNGTEGRVEVCSYGTWGTVCDDFWGAPDARVVCRQLGFSRSGAVAVTNARLGRASANTQIFLDNVRCNGTEDRLFDCPANPLGTHNCAHSEDAGVRCQLPVCEDGDIRLVGGASSSEGRVEFCNEAEWGTVCDDVWGNADAQVVCRQLGLFATGALAFRNARFGQGTGQIWLDNVNCRGTEQALADCSANPIGVHNCAHSEDAGVRCRTPCTNGDIRLAGGANILEGRVEVCFNNQWGTVCDDAWGVPDATVACRQLGHLTTGAQSFSRAFFGQGTGSIVLDQLNCAGTEPRLFNCPRNPLGVHDCSHTEDAGVRCQNASITCTTGDVRLVNGSNATEGRVEYCDSNVWGTVCDDAWGTPDAMVVCRQLGFASDGAVALSQATFGEGTGPILLDNVRCVGTEPTLQRCQSNGLGVHNCVHSEDAGVRCMRASTRCTTGDIRLVNGSNANEGRVEVCSNNAWGTVCDDFWSSFDAAVACRQLGFSAQGAIALPRAPFGQGTGPILLDNLFCTGTQLFLFNCTHNGVGNHNCAHSEDAGLRCLNNTVRCTNGNIRLIGGSTSFQGRVEICWNNEWATVCDDFWSANDAMVACRQLGLNPTGAAAVPRAAFGQGSTTTLILLDNVGCIGSETRLIDCSNTGLGIHNCAHSEDAGVICQSGTQSCANGDLRLQGGANVREGRVEFCNNNVWGTVCDDFWGTPDANVVCRQLGFSPTGNTAIVRALFGQGTGIIWLDNVNCAGTETRLADCPANPLGSHNCAHSEDAGVRCEAIGTPTPTCSQGDIRLRGGANDLEGRVEFCNNGVWGTVCDDLWGTPDATVVCRQLGFSTVGAQGFFFAFFGQGTGNIWLDNVGCRGSERRLADCPANPIGSHNCVHFEDASVRCQPLVTTTPPSPCTQGSIRLVGGTTSQEGRVEVCNNNAWGTVCDDAFTSVDAQVACRQLGFAAQGATARCCAGFGQGTGQIVLDQLNCVGTETSLFNCPANPIGTHDCSHSEDVGVTCRIVCNNGDLRLQGGTNDREGRVEICNNQAWGTVCDDFWDVTDAGVACFQLGYTRAGAAAFSQAFFGQGTGGILLDNLGCVGTETRLVDCPHNGVNIHNCVHAEDAGLRCAAGCQNGRIRLVGGASTLEGRVELCNSNSWGTVCDDAWGIPDASVVCRQLGFSPNGSIARTNAFYGQGTGPIHLDNVNCLGTESSLTTCPSNPIGIHNCVHAEDAGVTCSPIVTQPPPRCTDWDLRLVNGGNEREGRVEICRNGTWGTVCDDFWDARDASVVCAQLGFSRSGAIAHSRATFGQGTGPIYLDDVRCTGNEPNIQNCSLLLTHNCIHAEDAGVTCLICSQGDVRLAGTSTNVFEGRVEVCNNQQWGTVCDDLWGTPDAAVTCRQLGFSRFNAQAISFARFGAGTGPIVLDNVQCVGTEARLFDCPNNGLGVHNCIHSEDASVRCNQTLVCNHGQVRLVGGQSNSEGRVEVCVNETWGTVCDDSWGTLDAGVICRVSGFSRFNATALAQAAFGQGTGPIVLDDVACTGTEVNILSCPYDPITTDCTHREDAGVRCQTERLCADGDIRLVGGMTEYEGRVELCYGEQWGTICDDFWGTPDANVVCRQLGYNATGATAFNFAFFGQGTGPIWIDDVECIGTEERVISCRHTPIGIHNCIHLEDAGVRCPAPEVPCMSGDVRLVGGATPNLGRVEFCQSGTWGTVCDDFWGVQDARVVCRQLGYSISNATAFSNARFGQGTGNIYLDNVRCTGNEAMLSDCPANAIGTHNCVHAEDAGVSCQVCDNGDIRLVGGSVISEGRVEICVNFAWGTVCDDFWGVPDATVVCRQLGFSDQGAMATTFAFFGQGTDPIVLDDVRCVGTESRLIDCPYTPTHNCIHLEDAGVRCQNVTCVDGEIRLQNGTQDFNGRLEICINGTWGTICNGGFSGVDASVACRQLGFSRFRSFYWRTNPVPMGSGPIHINNIGCRGTEGTILSCPYNTNVTGCTHAMDVDIGCRAEPLCNDSDIRLVNGADEYEGRVEICFNETWGSICDGLWSTNDANVACRQLGYAATGARPFYNAFYGQGTGPVYLDDLLCTGRESRLIDCRNGGVNMIDNCRGHLDDAGLRCAENCTHGDLRLVGGETANEGRLEICFNAVWGTVCDDFWGAPDAQVTCSQLGYTRTGAQAFSFAFFGQGTGPIHIDNVQCVGTETTLLGCRHLTIDNCVHAEDAGVRCQGCANGDIRLVGGASVSEGRVELCMGSTWGTVCDDFWGVQDARVVCRQLGYSINQPVARVRAFFGAGTGQILLDNVQCTGTESRLVDCPAITMHNCNHGEDAGVTCVARPVCQTGEVRLVNGTNATEGRVEVCINETWGTVCFDGWDAPDAQVVCSQLGYSRFNAVAIPNSALFGRGSNQPIFVDNAACVGSEPRLLACNYDSHTADCFHFHDVGVQCNASLVCEYGALRLVNGTTNLEGRLEICINETWGTICDGFWSTFDATVACRQLGFNPVGALPLYNAAFGPGVGMIWLDDLLCNNREQRLIDCPNGGIGMTDFCNGHNDDAGLRCLEGCVNGAVRLIGGMGPYEGRVEFCSDQQWGTICHDLWGEPDARVVCRQLGYSTINATAYSGAFYGAGTGNIFLDNVACTGTEDNISSCVADTDTSDCSHAQDAGVSCQVDLFCTNGELRLMGGSTESEGRVEICVNETWGTICDDSWGPMDAQVACRGLGFSRFNAMAFSSASYGQGTGPVFLSQLQCTGNEPTLLNCPSSPPVNCPHTRDAGVRCQGAPMCQDGDLRLTNSLPGRNYSGRVEICVNEQWSTLCDRGWGQTEGNVACRQLGFSRYGATARGGGFFGTGDSSQNIYSVDLNCTGDELTLFSCPSTIATGCSHSNDAALECNATLLCEENSVRLVGGTLAAEGRVEVCINETYGTICDNGWTTNDANIVCRQLGYLSRGAVAYPNARFGQGTGQILFSNLQCSGTENSIFECMSGDFGTCTHADDAAVMCQEACTNGVIRLVGGTTEYEGRVEVCINEIWGTVCDDFWGTLDAQVVCRQLGYSESNATALRVATFGAGTGPIHLDDVFCLGFEDNLVNCSYDSNTADCLHFEDAGVRCMPCDNGEIRLEGGTSLYNGRVELCRGQTWGGICDNSWSSVDATVACRNLGYSGFNAQAFSNARFGQGTTAIFYDSVQCSGSEVRLSDCPSSPGGSCGQADNAGIMCLPTPVCSENDIRLVGGRNPAEGRVEVCVLETWRTICNMGWGVEEAGVVCRQLGYSRFNASANDTSLFGPGTGPIYGTNLRCTAEEARLVDCVSDSDVTSCSHAADAGVTCNRDLICQNADLRLVNGSVPYIGRLEICWNETWGTVCDQSWSTFDANVACRQLGYAAIGTPRYNAFYGQGLGPVLLDDLICTGTEARLIDCRSGGIGMTDFCRGHLDDAGLECRESCVSGSIRFVGGSVAWEGRVEVCKGEAWGTVCDDLWDANDANVACRQAGFSGINSTAISGPQSTFGSGTGPIHFDDLGCTGTEATLFSCTFDSTPNCQHSEDAAIRCVPRRICNDGQIRLSGGSTTREGRVEVCYNETWGSICDNFWSSNDGAVVCRELGYSQFASVTQSGGFFGAGFGPIYLGSVQCTGNEANITACPNGSIAGCTHANDAGVTCRPKICTDGDVRLVGAGGAIQNPLMGRVEVCINEMYGTVCDTGFDRNEASVVCGQLGFSRIRASALPSAAYGPGMGNIYLTSLMCSGNETGLLDCDYGGTIGSTNCAHSQDASVICDPQVSNPQRVAANALSNITVNVSWAVPPEFYSTLIKYSVTCNTTTSTRIAQTMGANQYSIVVAGLTPFTAYNCCVTARYTNAAEDALTCANVTTREGIPGPPINLVATLNPAMCTRAVLTWDLPPPDERNGNIAGYLVNIMATDDSGFSTTMTPTSNNVTVNMLTCCTGYSFTVTARTLVGSGQATLPTTFRTPAEMTQSVQIQATALNATNVRVTWMIPTSVSSQGVNAFTVVLIPECLSGIPSGGPRTFNNDREEVTQANFGTLEPFVPYRVVVSATICQSPLILYNNTVFTQQGVVAAPVIDNVARTSTISAGITFSVPPSERNADHFEVRYYASTGPTNSAVDTLVDPLRTIPVSDPGTVQIDTLTTCQSYWVTVTAVNCASRIQSQVAAIGVQDPLTFETTLALPTGVACSTWISDRQATKITNLEALVLSTLNGEQCGMPSVRCTIGSTLTCGTDPTKATFFITLVSTDVSPSQMQLDCLVEWAQNAQTVDVGGQTLTLTGSTVVVGPGTTQAGTQATPVGGANISYVYAIVAIVVVGIIIAILLIVVILVVRRRDKPVARTKTHEQMLDDQDDLHSTHSIGIVENPLYAEQEEYNTPSYATLKEKEAEAELDGYEEKPSDFSINFDPPGDDY